VVTFEGWVPADPTCCDGHPECAGSAVSLRTDPGDPACPPVERLPTGQESFAHHVVGKSFIGPVHTEHGDKLQASMLRWGVSFVEESPPDDRKKIQDNNHISKDPDAYRLRTEMDPAIACNRGKLLTANIRKRDFHVGYEYIPGVVVEGMDPGFWVQGVMSTGSAQVMSVTEQCATFRADVGGEPHPIAAFGLKMIAGYELRTIRHSVEAVLCCDGRTSFDVTGTKFPSHRLFVDGQRVQDVPQGPVEELQRIDHPEWMPLPNECYMMPPNKVCEEALRERERNR
jgi:hypothetical protein